MEKNRDVQKKKRRGRWKSRTLSLLISVALILGMMPVTAFAYTEPVSYIDENGVLQTLSADSVIELTQDNLDRYEYELEGDTDKWYIVSAGATLSGNYIKVTGDVKLILEDGCQLTTSDRIEVTSGSKLTIYGGSEGSGSLMASGVYSGYPGIHNCGEVVINGGNITANGGSCSAGIGAYGANGDVGTITINGGTVIATGGDYGAGIGGGGSGCSGGIITINGGNVTATGGHYGSGIGGGSNGEGGKITINNGTVTATGGYGGAGIGGGFYGKGGEIIIKDGDVKAIGGIAAAGIGGGRGESGGNITINGGTVDATEKNSEDTGSENQGYTDYETGGAGIGGGLYGSGGNITINGGTVNATGEENGAGIGNGVSASSGGCTINVNAGTVTATGGANAAGIGGGSDQFYGDTITISGGTVTATGGANAAGIGYGAQNNEAEISAFSTGTDGSAVINTTSISDESYIGNSDTSGIIFIDNEGKVYGNPTVTTDFTIAGGQTLEILEGNVLSVAEGVTIENNGLITNSGTINNYGTIDSTGGVLIDNGTINNGDAGVIIPDSKTTLTVDQGCTMTITEKYSLSENSQLVNNGELIIEPDVTLSSGVQIINYGTMVCKGGLSVEGSAKIINFGEILVAAGEAPEVFPGSTGVIKYKVSPGGDLSDDDIYIEEVTDDSFYDPSYAQLYMASVYDDAIYVKAGREVSVICSQVFKDKYDSIGNWSVNDEMTETSANDELRFTMPARVTEVGITTHKHKWILAGGNTLQNMGMGMLYTDFPEELNTVLKKTYGEGTEEYEYAYRCYSNYLGNGIAIICVGDGDCGESTYEVTAYNSDTDEKVPLYRTGGRMTLEAPTERESVYEDIHMAWDYCEVYTNVYSGVEMKPEIIYDNEPAFRAGYYELTGMDVPDITDISYKYTSSDMAAMEGYFGDYTEIPRKAGYYNAYLNITYAQDGGTQNTLSLNTFYSITQKDIKVIADAKTKKYGEEDPELTFTVEGLADCDKDSYGDLFDGVLVCEKSGVEAAGSTYVISKGSLTLLGDNYIDAGFESSTLTVTQGEVAVPEIGSKTYTGDKLTADVPNSDLYFVEGNPGGIDVGAYNVVLSLTDPENYKWNTDAVSEKDPESGDVVVGDYGIVTLKFRITRAVPELEVSTQFKDNKVVYGEEPFALNVSSNSATDGALDQYLSYISSNENEVKVDKYGFVTIVGSGTSNITVNLAETDNYTSASESIRIMVLQADGNIRVKKNETTITYGDAFSMDSLYSFAETPEFFEFSSSNDDVITFDKYGNAQVVGAGNATVTLDAGDTNNYQKCSATFEITVSPADIKKSCDITVDIPETGYTYDGNAKKPEVKVEFSGTVLTKDTDYEVSYKDNTDAGEATVTIIGIGNFTGDVEETFTIKQAKNSLKPAVTPLTWTYGDGSTLPTYKADFGRVDVICIKYDDNGELDDSYRGDVPEEAGNYEIILSVTETDNYEGLDERVPLTINKAKSNLSVDETIDATYGDTDKSIKPKYDGDGNITYEISEEDKKVATVDENGNITIIGAGTATVTVNIAATTNYKADSKEVTIKVAEAKLEDCDISLDLPEDGYIYDGTAKKPTVVASFADSTLTKDTDYEVSYNANKNVGTATATITGKGNFTGTVTKEFSISQTKNGWLTTPVITGWIYGDKANAPTFEAKYGNNTAKIEYRKNDADEEAGESAETDEADAEVGTEVAQADEETDATADGYTTEVPTEAGNYTVRVTIPATDDYGVLVSDGVNFTIAQKDIAGATVTLGDSLTYTGEEQTQTVTGVSVGDTAVTTYDVSGDAQTNAGTYTLTVTGTGNFTGSTTAGFTIKKAATAPNAPDSALTPEHTVKTVADVNLPTGWQWSENDKNTELADNEAVTATANYIGKDAGNYETVSVEITITRQPCEHKGGTATCTAQAVCTKCNEPYGDVDDTNHTGIVENVDAKEATCTEDGYTGDTKCNDCGAIIKQGETVKATGHTGGTATCTKKAVCTKCNESYGDVDDTNHTGIVENVDAKEATCTEDGYTGDTKCTDCRATIKQGETVKATGHTGGTATCTKKAVCTKCNESYGDVDKANHTNVVEKVGAKEASCTEDGYTGDTKCNDCGTIIKQGEAIAAIGHTGRTATCTKSAVCTKCNESYGDVDKANHTNVVEKVGAKEASCTEDGYTGDTKCTDCGAIIKQGETVKAAGHTGGTATCTKSAVCTTCKEAYGDVDKANHTNVVEKVGAKDASCTEDGYTGDTKCNDCGTTIVKGETISASGHKGGTATCTAPAVCENCNKPYGTTIAHNYKSEITKEATAKEEGEITYTCSVCGDTYTESIPVKEVEPPYIAGDSENQGWDVIRNETGKVIEELTANPGEEKTVTVIMNGAVEVPADIFEQIRGKDVTIVFVMDNGIKWSVDGNSVTGDNIKDINFEVLTEGKANKISDDIIAEVINNVTGVRYKMNLTLAYEGEFGFTAVMNIGLKEENAGYYANLFYHNKTTNKLEFICADRIATDGSANLTFTHASDYVIIIDEESLDPNAASVEEPSEKPSEETPEEPSEIPDDGKQTEVEKPSVATPSDAEEEPTTEASVEEGSTTGSTVDEKPTTEATVNEEPTTEAPIKEEPTTGTIYGYDSAPSNEQPATEAPTTVTEAPVDVTEAPTTAAPADVTISTAAPATVTQATTEATEGEAPKTGDESKAPVAVLLLLISEIGIALSVMLRKKRR